MDEMSTIWRPARVLIHPTEGNLRGLPHAVSFIQLGDENLVGPPFVGLSRDTPPDSQPETNREKCSTPGVL